MRRLSFSRRSSARTATAAALLGLSVAAASCSSGADAPDDAPVETTSAATTTASENDEESAASSTESSTESESAAKDEDEASEESTTREPSASSELDKSVAKVYDVYKSLAPKDLFAQFERCDSTGGDSSYNCSGPKVGQFQFFKSHSKASQTTQVLTELRSSHAIEDDGDRVVGWSTLGTTAVITVVDNKEGLVMQQMISSDQVDPEEKIKELGLVKD
ncbi:MULTISPECIES: beta-N-acetylglucosaminidase [unclassified Corynebacterium]|uniref:beta-N-acetylglucosaminidase n=1 Tax=Corynebacterium TaxID=1716 RepID=UPI00254B69CE|nr:MULTISPECIES: beta-N-acetylglucosaminidase [unclassified Corynebacterium]MDK8451918.1 beta-N-acetylglucosaminidase [Corynebacterium sp. MSK084]MDK8513854.1 beta-N-acetylglucosaminidase [Corynebacterium sp. MSK123]MDK8546770.1 beta-N-acetylglucosaminidase [Corynebacterium sp. MSK222]MDK8672192.1 beta-N-acetylglucosaminidase [Corynebacterium sp. MSK189]MDK8702294.1 beta-N-acetylglucosaminidase [Corynebacterium sp. MSK107]